MLTFFLLHFLFYKLPLLLSLLPFCQPLWSIQFHKPSCHFLFIVSMPLCALMLVPIFNSPYTDLELKSSTPPHQNPFQLSLRWGITCFSLGLLPLVPSVLLCFPSLVSLCLCVCVYRPCSGHHPPIQLSAPTCLPYAHIELEHTDAKALLPSLFIRYDLLYISFYSSNKLKDWYGGFVETFLALHHLL